jgi:hypothetical protein
MPGLDPGIHPFAKKMDCRIRSGNDEVLYRQLAFPYPPAVGVRITMASPASSTVASQA